MQALSAQKARTASAPPRILDRRNLGLLACSHVVDDIYQGAVPAILPFLVLDLGFSYAAAAGITLAATISSSVAQPMFGLLADRRDLRWLPPVSLLIAGGGIALIGLGTSYLWVWLVVALSGLGVAAYHPSAARAARTASGTSAQGMSWFALGGNIGIALGPILTTPLILAFGLQATPLLIIPAVLMAFVLAGTTSRSRPVRSDGNASKAPSATGLTDDWRSFSWLTGLVIVRSIAYFGIGTMISLYVIDRFNVSEATGSLTLTTFLLVGALATVPGGWLADRNGRLPTIALGYALMIPALLVLLWAPSVGYALVASAFLGISIYLPFSVQTTLGQDYLPNRIGTASGVTLGLAIAAGGVLAPVFGLIADAFSLHAALAVLLILSPIALLIVRQLPEPQQPRNG